MGLPPLSACSNTKADRKVLAMSIFLGWMTLLTSIFCIATFGDQSMVYKVRLSGFVVNVRVKNTGIWCLSKLNDDRIREM